MLILGTQTETDAFIFATELQGSEKVIQYSKEESELQCMQACGVRVRVHTRVCVCVCMHVRARECVCECVRVQRGFLGTGPAEQNKEPLPCSLGKVSLQPGRGVGCPALPVSKAVNERSPKAVAGRAVPARGAAPWLSVAEDGPRQLVR